MRKGRNRIFSGMMLLLLLLGMAGLSACGAEENAEEDRSFYIYRLSDTEDALLTERFLPLSVDTLDGTAAERSRSEAEEEAYQDALTKELLDALQGEPSAGGMKRLLPDGVSIENYQRKDQILTIYFSESYASMDPVREVLARAGIVKTMVQVSEGDRVLFYVGSDPLRDAAGNVVGIMRKETFVDNSAQQLNNYERDSVKLYFADETGQYLVEEPRAIYHSSSQPLEWAVVARLVEGPKAAGSYQTIPSDTEIISVSRAGEVCYVNFSKAFLSNTLDVADEIPIYSIVNSLVVSCNVKQVQIAVEGDIKVSFRDAINLDTLFERDDTLLRTE